MRIENEYLSLEIGTKGGSMTSIYDKKRNNELLYQKRKDSWQGQDIFIFPVIARLIDGTYEIDGKTYEFKNHGLLRYMDARTEKISETSMKAVFESDKNTLERYPFEFRCELNYSLEGRKIVLSYTIENKSDRNMPFMMGAHPAFRIPGIEKKEEFDISGNTIVFDTDKDLTILLQEDSFSFMTGEEKKIPSRIELDKELFRTINTVIVKTDDIEKVTLVKKDGSKLVMDKGRAPYIALWSDMHMGDYVCIEPWFGLPDQLDSAKDLFTKKGVEVLGKGEVFKYSYSLSVE